MNRYVGCITLFATLTTAAVTQASPQYGGTLGDGEARCRTARLTAARLPLYGNLFANLGASPSAIIAAQADIDRAAKAICKDPDGYLSTPGGRGFHGFLFGLAQQQAQTLGMSQPEGEAHVLGLLEDETAAVRKECSIETDRNGPHWMLPKPIFEAQFRSIALGTCNRSEVTPPQDGPGANRSSRSGVTGCLTQFAGAAKNTCNDPRADNADSATSPPSGWGTSGGTSGPPQLLSSSTVKDASGGVTKSETWKGADGSTYQATLKTDAKGTVTFFEIKGDDGKGHTSQQTVKDDKVKNEARAKVYEEEAKNVKMASASIIIVGSSLIAAGPDLWTKGVGVAINAVGGATAVLGTYIESMAAKERNKRCLGFDSGPQPMTYSPSVPIDTRKAFRACMCKDAQAQLTSLPGGNRTAAQGGLLASMTQCPNPTDALRADCLANLYGTSDKPRQECLALLEQDSKSALSGFAMRRMCGLVLCAGGMVSRETPQGTCACLPSGSSHTSPDLYGGTACEHIKCDDTQTCECTSGGACGCKSPFTRVPGLCQGEPCPVPGRAPR